MADVCSEQKTVWEAEIERLKVENRRLSKQTDYGTYVGGVYPVFGEKGSIQAVESFNRHYEELKAEVEQLRDASRLYEPGKKVIQKAILYALYFAVDPNGQLAEMVRTELFEAVSEYPDRVVEVCIATGEEVKE